MGIKVGILSMQRIQNYGSFLQAYGLMQILKELGCEVQFVDYHPGQTLIRPSGGTGLTRKLSKAKTTLLEGGPLKEKIRFILYKKNYAKKYYPYLGINEKKNYSPKVDLLIIGSDEVFNCVQDNPNVGFSPELFGQNSRAKKIVSYAASFGNTTLEKLDQYEIRNKVAKWLGSFDEISVRDKNSEMIVKELVGNKPYYNIDPVLAYDFVGQCKRVSKKVYEKNYLILYGYSGRFTRNECMRIRRYADRKGLKILCIGGVQYCCDRFVDVDPFSVISFFQSAECVVTDTFHGTIMSVITHRKFVVLTRENGYGNSQKIVDLLERLGLNDRHLLSIRELGKIQRRIDYSSVDSIIEKEREKTREYLKKQIII